MRWAWFSPFLSHQLGVSNHAPSPGPTSAPLPIPLLPVPSPASMLPAPTALSVRSPRATCRADLGRLPGGPGEGSGPVSSCGPATPSHAAGRLPHYYQP
ncbi:JM1 [macacine gammaherpesvirus 11]|uniref:JM1 n=2 Tax=macacine gammaherpesvirus 11 TaxID=2560570 RepID=G9JMH9_9GAMA|nr:JM1 [Macaca fuscata rhadinovirus]AAS99978.1 JM1 [Macaca fuscata rhadinovirus]AEW87526.1 JM1 [Macaca fuscata rhadinovirus]AEW87696.1 JM1 [Macaca fuscata rhadinovirus]